MNLLLNCDSYKNSHFLQYPENCKYINSYIEARSGDGYQDVVFFGLQAFLKEYLSKPFTANDIAEAEEVSAMHGVPFNKEGWEYILQEYNGFLPLEIQALPEGSVVPRGMPLVQVINTDPNVAWLTSWIETALLRSVWYPTNVATITKSLKNIISKYLNMTCDAGDAGIGFFLNDFSSRGVSSFESSGIAGLGHLVNFQGTDNLPAIMAARKYYDCKMAGYSIPATEHSSTTIYGQEHEVDAFDNMITKFGNGQLLACVTDSYDHVNAVTNLIGGKLKDKILAMNATFVVRPDSGTPKDIVLQTVQILWDCFGGTINKKGFKVLNPKVRVIQGDGINHNSVVDILQNLVDNGFSVENIVLGCGGYLGHNHTRDDMRFAMKASAGGFDVNGTIEWQDIQKNPKTDPSKKSKAGRQIVYIENGTYKCSTVEQYNGNANLLKPVWRNGKLLVDQTLDEIRTKSNS